MTYSHNTFFGLVSLFLGWSLLVACSRPQQKAPSLTDTPQETQAANASPTSAATSVPLSQVSVKPERAFPALGFQNMTGLYDPGDGTNRLFVLEQPGRIRVFENREDVQSAQVFLDITSRVNSRGNEEGLLGLAFAPDFATSGHFFLDYTAANPRRTVISRFTVASPRDGVADPASEFVILEIDQPYENHNGGQIAFGPDGYLYIGMGDGGSAFDPQKNGQNLGVLLGKLLRIDVSQGEGEHRYRIPRDNPFVGQQGARGEIWAYGLRNPWRFSFDRPGGALWLGDVGQNAREEIDLIAKGGNYGWSRMEGTLCVPASVATCDRTGLTLPILDYPTKDGNCAVTGGFIYRGNAAPSLKGSYIYGDFCSGRIWALRYDGSQITENALLVDSTLSITSFGVDSRGELYVLDRGSRNGIYRLTQ